MAAMLAAAPRDGANPALETAIVRELRAVSEKIDAAQKLADSPFEKDLVTTNLKLWTDQSLKQIAQKRITLDFAIRDLKGILTDVVAEGQFGASLLDDEAVLGSDRQTYGFKSLSVIYNSDEGRQRFPATFKVIPHIVVRDMVAWLKSKTQEIVIPNDRVKREYRDLTRRLVRENQKNSLRIEFPNHWSNKKAHEDRREEEEADVRSEKQQSEFDIFQKELGEGRKRLAVLGAPVIPNIRQEIEKSDREFYQRIVEIQRKEQPEFNAMLQALAQLENAIAANRKNNEEQQKEVDLAGQAIDAARRETIRTKQAVNEAETAIKKRKKAMIRTMIITSVIAGTCIIASGGLSALFKELGIPFEVGLAPCKDGAMLFSAFSI